MPKRTRRAPSSLPNAKVALSYASSGTQCRIDWHACDEIDGDHGEKFSFVAACFLRDLRARCAEYDLDFDEILDLSTRKCEHCGEPVTHGQLCQPRKPLGPQADQRERR